MKSDDVDQIVVPTRDRKLIVMMFVNLIVNTGFSYVIPFYPVLAYQEAKLDYTMIGILMSINSVGSTLSAYIFGQMIQVWGRKRFYVLSLFLQSMIMACYGSVYFLTEHKWTFFWVSVVMRLSEGISRSFYAVTTFNYLNVFWKSTFPQKFSLMETTASLGMIIGPVLGSLLNYFFGYWKPLLALSLLFQICFLLTFIFIPSDSSLHIEGKKKEILPLKYAFSHKHTFITFITMVVTRATLIYFNSFFSHHMFSYELSQNTAALVLSIPQVSQIISTLILPKIFKTLTQFEFLQSFSVAVSFVGATILSPAWNNQGDLAHIYIGMILMGIGSAMNRLPAIPVLQNQLIKFKFSASQSSDMAGAIFQMNMSCSNLIFPLLGGGLYDLFGGKTKSVEHEFQAFRTTMLALVVVQVIVFCVDLYFNKSYKIYCKQNEVRSECLTELVDESKVLIKAASRFSDTNDSDTTASVQEEIIDDKIQQQRF